MTQRIKTKQKIPNKKREKKEDENYAIHL